MHIRQGASMEECEKTIIRETLSWLNGNKSKTAQTLGIGRKTLLRKLDDYGLAIPDNEKHE
jgi:DNA-binding NtrC family response regulator